MPPSAGAGAGAAGAATDTRVSTVKTNLKYLALGNKAGVHPNSVATRGVLKTARYVSL
jgi:hypothetical protein